jgi:capsular exopolysaccharide synthesis family protein
LPLVIAEQARADEARPTITWSDAMDEDLDRRDLKHLYGDRRDVAPPVPERDHPQEDPPQAAPYVAFEAFANDPGRRKQTFQGLLRQLWRRRWPIVLATLAGAAAGFAVARAIPSLYTGEARVLVGVPNPRILKVENVIADMNPGVERVQSEGFLLQSRAIAAQVIAQLRLDQSPAFNPDLQLPSPWSLASLEERLPGWAQRWVRRVKPAPPDATPTAAERASAIVDQVLSQVDVATLVRSHVLSIKAEAPDPVQAASIANAFAEKYLEAQRRDKVSTIDRVDGFLMQRIGELRNQVKKSDQAIEDYRRLHGLYKSGSGSVTSQQLAELNTHLLAAQTAKAGADSRLAEAQALRGGKLNSDTVPEVLQSPLIGALKQQQADTERRAAEVSAVYGDQHPLSRSTRAEAASLAGRINAEVARTIEGVARDARTADARYAAMLQQFEDLKSKMGVVNDKSIHLEALEREAVINRNLLEAMLNRAKEGTGAAEVLEANAKLVSAAVPAERPAYPPKALITLLTALAAFLISAAVALAAEAGDRTFRRAEEIEALTGVPVLSLIPQIRSRTAAQKVVREPHSPYGEALRRLFLGIEPSDTGRSPKTLLFSSAAAGEGKSVMVASLARLLAGMGKRVLVIDCDWRNPCIHRLLRCRSRPGLSELLTDRETVLTDCVRRDGLSDVDVIPSGAWNANLSHLLNSDRMRDLLALIGQSYDVILLDCAPVLVTADALSLSRIVQQVVYVVRWGHTRRDAAFEGLKQFFDAQANVAGVAVSQVRVKEYQRDFPSGLSHAPPPMATYRYGRADKVGPVVF